MKKMICLVLSFLLILLASCATPSPASEAYIPETIPTTVPVTVFAEKNIPTAEPTTVTTIPKPVIALTEEEKTMLLKLGMAERGNAGCVECIALVMRTVLNRVEADRFANSIHGVIFAQEQFTPVTDGSYYTAEPNEACHEALDLVIYGWDESQGALFYEWCEGESWHSQNLHLLFQHCDVRFYD